MLTTLKVYTRYTVKIYKNKPQSAFALHNKYTKQMEDSITSLHIIHQGKPTQREPTQPVFGTKPPSAKTWSARNHPDSIYALSFIRFVYKHQMHVVINLGQIIIHVPVLTTSSNYLQGFFLLARFFSWLNLCIIL